MARKDLINAKQELLQVLGGFKIIAANVIFGDDYSDEEQQKFKLNPLYTEDDYNAFLEFMDRDYDSGYGGQNLFGTIFCEDNIWLDRGEYDGSEWWSLNKYPNLRDHFDENVVIRYERNRKLKNLNNS